MRALKPIALVLATGLGTGYSPLAPGTAGSLLACLLAWFLLPVVWWAQLAAAAVCFALGTWVSFVAESWWGKDPTKVVIDEVAGQWLSLLLVPKSVPFYLAAFVLFRIFDILKPWGIARMQEARGGWGVMLDDLLAGIYTNIALQLALLAFLRKASALGGLLPGG